MAALVVGLLAARCASAAEMGNASIDASSIDCGELKEKIARTEDERNRAQENKQQAAKLILPVVVAGTYVVSSQAVDRADKQLAELRAEFVEKGCARHED